MLSFTSTESLSHGELCMTLKWNRLLGSFILNHTFANHFHVKSTKEDVVMLLF